MRANPRPILGQNVSSGCIRMLNADVIDLYIHDCERLLETSETSRWPPMGNLRENARRPLTITARVLAVGPDQPAAMMRPF